MIIYSGISLHCNSTFVQPIFVVFKPQKPRHFVMKIIGKLAGLSFLNLPSIDHSDESRVPSDSNKKRCKRDMLMDDRHIKLNNTS